MRGAPRAATARGDPCPHTTASSCCPSPRTRRQQAGVSDAAYHGRDQIRQAVIGRSSGSSRSSRCRPRRPSNRRPTCRSIRSAARSSPAPAEIFGCACISSATPAVTTAADMLVPLRCMYALPALPRRVELRVVARASTNQRPRAKRSCFPARRRRASRRARTSSARASCRSS